MQIRVLPAALAVLACLTTLGWAQFRDDGPQGADLGEAKVQRWQAGLTVTAVGGPCKGIEAMIPIPADWPEQQVKVVDEEVSPGVSVTERTVGGTAKVMLVKIPLLAAGKEAKATTTFEITRSAILPPEDTDVYRLPDRRRLDRKARVYLAPSPKIESQNPLIRKKAKEIIADHEKAWDKVEAIYDWVRENVQYKNGPLKGALAALKDGTGDCEELTSLFIAMCRAINVPARTVWVPDHCYPEFYLVDASGKGRWFPCQAAGDRAFGGIPEHRPILQKGDNFRPPHNPREKQRYLAEHLTGAGGSPRVRFIRQLLPN